MEPFTIAVAVVASIAALVLRPGRATGVIVMSMLLWPEYLRVPMGLAQMSAPRIAAFFLAARMVAGDPLPRWRWADVVGLVWGGWGGGWCGVSCVCGGGGGGERKAPPPWWGWPSTRC